MRDDSVDLWALDEVHFHQHGSRCRMWVPPETRDPVVYHHPTRKSVGYFAAVRCGWPFFGARGDSTESPSGFLKVERPALFPAVAYSPSVTTRRITALSSICPGVTNRLHNFAWTFCLPTARNSIPSNESGNSRVGCVCTIVTSDSSMGSFPRLKASSPNGRSPTISCDVYAQLLKTLRLTRSGVYRACWRWSV